MSDELAARIRQRVADAIGPALDVGPDFTPEADAVLAALGLDDLDAAVHRAAPHVARVAVFATAEQSKRECEATARAVLTAALCPTETSEP